MLERWVLLADITSQGIWIVYDIWTVSASAMEGTATTKESIKTVNFIVAFVYNITFYVVFLPLRIVCG